ncbi:MAG: CHAP domain-containing protein [Streptococcaceae bacterium]|jgi:peptidoglycan hydrolase CwlO-like protein|nr:CHAP domain-containing protein [Streptococcaceae bacterium]
MMKKKQILASLMLSTVLLSSAGLATTSVVADTNSDIAKQDQTIQSAQSGAAAAKAQQDSLQSQVDAAQKTLDALTAQQQANSAKIKTLTADIKERKDSLAAQARSAQTDGGVTSYINTILNAKSLTDAVQKITAMSEVVSANNDMVAQQEQDEKTFEKKMADNQAKYAQATALQVQLTQQQAQLKVAQLNYQATITTATSEKNSLLAQKAAAEKAAQAAAAQKAAYEAHVSAANASTNAQTNANSNGGGGGTTPAATPGYSSGNPYPWGQCTWGVWQILGGKMPTYSGNAGNWVAYANSGLAVGTIAVFPPGVDGAGGVGHVAVVTAVASNGSFTIEETNYAGGLGVFHTRTIPSAAGVSFIRP